MQRRQFSQSLLGLTAGLVGVGASAPAWAQGGFAAGKDYKVLEKPLVTDVPAGKIEVNEFFSYGCIHCFRFETAFEKWISQQSADVVVRRVHVAFNAQFVPWQQMYYALEALGMVDQLHQKFFKAIHEERKRLTNANAIADWVGEQGVDKAKFTAAYNSFGVAGKAKRAAQLQDAYMVEGTPAVTVGGRFYIPGQGDRTLAIASSLVDVIRKG